MPITQHIDKANHLTCFKVTGELSFEDILHTIKAFYADDPTNNVLWDLIDTTKANLDSEKVESIAALRSNYAGTREPGKTAIVAKSDLLFGLSRMLEVNSELQNVSYPIMVFRNLDDAYQWLNEP